MGRETARVICTGMSGAGTVDYIDKVCAFFEERGEQGQFDSFNIGELIIAIAREQGYYRGDEIKEFLILNMASPAVVALRAAAFERAMNKVRDKQAYPFLAGITHALFPWKNSIVGGFDVRYLDWVDPDFYITVIDDMATIAAELQNDPPWRDLPLQSLLTWRDEETFVTETMAYRGLKEMRKDHFLISKAQGGETLYHLMKESAMRRAYASYPISHVPDHKIQEAQQFVQWLSQYLVVFNPLCIKDMELANMIADLRHGKKEPWADYIGATDNAEEIKRKEAVVAVVRKLQGESVEEERLWQIEQHLRNQTVARDYKLIQQSEMVVVYYPELTIVEEELLPEVLHHIKLWREGVGEPLSAFLDRVERFAREGFIPLSAGVLSEMVTAYTMPREVYAIWRPNAEPSPFFRYHCTEIFGSPEELFKSFKEKGWLPEVATPFEAGVFD